MIDRSRKIADQLTLISVILALISCQQHVPGSQEITEASTGELATAMIEQVVVTETPLATLASP